jgi:hypothetical protein
MIDTDTDVMGEAERAAVVDRERNSLTGSRLLTNEEWAEILPPFYYLKITFDRWTNLEYEIALKRALENSEGWVYYRDKRFVFELAEDFTLFKMWAENRPMQNGEEAEL